MQVLFDDLVEEGFQASDTWHQGCIKHSSDALLGTVKSSIPYVHWAFSVRPVYGWGGGVDEQQQSTAGWLATLPALEPHWQVLMAHGLATGYVQWGPDKRIELKDTPLYAEKNWGQGFPKRWAWLQCNSFANCPDLAVTGAFAKRVALGSEENVGLIGVHHDGDFIEATPANGSVSWDVEPWGRWVMQGKSNKHEILAEATCSPDAGTVLRAPTGTQGLIPACKDTFAGALSCVCNNILPHLSANNDKSSLLAFAGTALLCACFCALAIALQQSSRRHSSRCSVRTASAACASVAAECASAKSTLHPVWMCR